MARLDIDDLRFFTRIRTMSLQVAPLQNSQDTAFLGLRLGVRKRRVQMGIAINPTGLDPQVETHIVRVRLCEGITSANTGFDS